MSFCRILLAAALIGATALSVQAAIPAPPVNQYLGLPDTILSSATEETCRSCHNQSPPLSIIEATYLPDRHHLLVGTTIPAITDVPNPDTNGDTVPDSAYGCYSCHNVVYNSTTSSYELDPNFRDCSICHQNTTVHHRAGKAQEGDCAACHGSFVDSGLSYDDTTGQVSVSAPWIPTYQESLITPWPSGKPATGTGTEDDRSSNLFGEKEGSCKFCHSNLSGINAQQGGLPATENTGPFAPVAVYTNADTHHNTGLATDSKCKWCHAFGNTDPILTASKIRTCEICHGIPSLHNFQAPVPGSSTINPGTEPAGYGHIGAQSDCDGCHDFDNPNTASFVPSSGPVVPALHHLSASSVHAGAAIDLYGTSFINQLQNPLTGTYEVTLTSQAVLVDAGDAEIVLEPINVFMDAMQVVLPADLPVGNYKIAAKKGTKLSNTLNLTVTPEVSVSSARCTSGQVTITGSGFFTYLDAVGSGTSVAGNGLAGAIQSWTDSEIVAQFPACPSTIDLATVFENLQGIQVASSDPVIDDPPVIDPPVIDDPEDPKGKKPKKSQEKKGQGKGLNKG